MSMTLLERMNAEAARFNQEIVGLTPPPIPTVLSGPRLEHSVEHLSEELQEFYDASKAGNVEEAADGLLDLIYVAMGRLFEMGVTPGAAFMEVNRANQSRVRGTNEKRPNSAGFDAVKPEGWTPPDLWPYLTPSRDDLVFIHELRKSMTEPTAEFKELRDLLGWVDDVSPVHVRLAKLRAAKGKDYNTGVALTDYFPFGHESYAQLIYMKAMRLRSLIEVMRAGGKPNFEGIEDTVLDLLNYGTFYAEAISDGGLQVDKGEGAR